MIQFEILGVPPKKDRPRFSGKRAYSTESNKMDDQRVKLSFKNSGHSQLNGLLSVTIEAIYTCPKSWSKKKTLEHLGQPKGTKPDIDNVVKGVLDGLNGYAYEDDNQVVQLTAVKRYGTEDKTVVTISELK